MKKFHFSHYWRTWSRNIGVFKSYFVELNLTPVNPAMEMSWEREKKEIFRAHFTVRDKKDIETDELPKEVIGIMISRYGQELTNKLINFDYLSEITLEDIVKSNRGGGTSFYEIKAKTK